MYQVLQERAEPDHKDDRDTSNGLQVPRDIVNIRIHHVQRSYAPA
jgi:hypothetical protein